MKNVISSNNAPKATGPFSQAILFDKKYSLELSGQIGIDPKNGTLVEGGITEETKQTLSNIKAILSEVGWDFKNVVKSRIYLTDMKDYSTVNELYAEAFSENPPARIALAVKNLPLGALVEIECSAAGDNIQE